MKFKNIIACLLGLALLLPVSSSSGELYKWVDDRGNIHYGDKPPKKAELEKITRTQMLEQIGWKYLKWLFKQDQKIFGRFQ